MTKYDELLNNRYSYTVLLMKQITKQHSNVDHAWNHINDHPNMANHTTSRQRKEFFLTIFSFLFGPTEKQTVKQLKKNVAIPMENQMYSNLYLKLMPKPLI